MQRDGLRRTILITRAISRAIFGAVLSLRRRVGGSVEERSRHVMVKVVCTEQKERQRCHYARERNEEHAYSHHARLVALATQITDYRAAQDKFS